MGIRFTLLLTAALMLCTPYATAAEEISAEKKAVMDELMQMTGMDNMVRMMISGMTQMVSENARATYPERSEAFHNAVQEEITGVLVEEMVEKKGLYHVIYPIYDKYFTIEELRQMVEFYSTPLGKKMIEKMPSVMQESMTVGQEWSMSLLPKIDARIKARLEADGLESN